MVSIVKHICKNRQTHGDTSSNKVETILENNNKSSKQLVNIFNNHNTHRQQSGKLLQKQL
jgi:hypothetical protein